MSREELQVLIGDPRGERIEIHPLDRPYTDADHDSDQNWLTCNILVRMGGFQGGYSAFLRAGELRRFRDELASLYDRLEGKAIYATLEEQLGFTLTCDRRGGIVVEGFARDVAGNGNRLEFSFEIDQSYLSRTLRELDEVVAAYPPA